LFENQDLSADVQSCRAIHPDPCVPFGSGSRFWSYPRGSVVGCRWTKSVYLEAWPGDAVWPGR